MTYIYISTYCIYIYTYIVIHSSLSLFIYIHIHYWTSCFHVMTKCVCCYPKQLFGERACSNEQEVLKFRSMAPWGGSIYTLKIFLHIYTYIRIHVYAYIHVYVYLYKYAPIWNYIVDVYKLFHMFDVISSISGGGEIILSPVRAQYHLIYGKYSLYTMYSMYCT